MKKIKCFTKALVVLLLVLMLISCGGSRRPAAETGAVAREPFELDIYSFSTGTFTYILGMAMADLINEKSDYIKATSVESPGSAPNEVMMYNANDYKRQHTMFFGVGDNAWRGTGEFEGRQTQRSKLAFSFSIVSSFMVTANPNIKTVEDLAGKRVGLRGSSSPPNNHIRALINAKAPNVSYDFLDYTSSVEANLSGAIDAWLPAAFAVASDFSKWQGNPATVEFFSRARDVNFISLPIDVDRALRVVPGGPFENFYNVVATLPPKAMEDRQTSPFNATMANSAFMVDQDFPEDVLYDILKIIVDNIDKLQDYHPQAAFISPQTMAIYTFPPEFHPGSVKYFGEVGVTPTFLGDMLK